ESLSVRHGQRLRLCEQTRVVTTIDAAERVVCGGVDPHVDVPHRPVAHYEVDEAAVRTAPPVSAPRRTNPNGHTAPPALGDTADQVSGYRNVGGVEHRRHDVVALACAPECPTSRFRVQAVCVHGAR